MIPSALASQLRHGLAEFLRASFWSSTPGLEHAIDDLLDRPEAILKGPYVSLKLPFVSGTNPNFFPGVPLDFMPHAHQELAFARLGGDTKLSTLIATGTGSGKTEGFLVPILDHCLQTAGTPGVKAILIYPMNALATDQAGRIEHLLKANPGLSKSVRAGLYIGESKKRKKGGGKVEPGHVITDRALMQKSPPDILLTNYKMLDYLLIRPGDQGIWQHNFASTLRFLVVDEIHCFDGAQGTDLACLVRRLKRRLAAEDGTLCCVGTSATLGGPEAAERLRGYAGQVFGQPFDAGAVIGEQKLTEAEFLAGTPLAWSDEPAPDDVMRLEPARATDPEAWLRAQVQLWFGSIHEAADPAAWAVALGERLRGHATFRALLEALGGRAQSLAELLDRMAQARSTWRSNRQFAEASLVSLIALVSAARSWREELPEAQREREAAGRPRPTKAFLDVRIQLWQRELSRLVATVEEKPQIQLSDDLDRDTRARHLPLVHCRECGAMGWGTRVERDKPHVLRTELTAFYRSYFKKDPRVQFLFPAAAAPRDDPAWKLPTLRVDTRTLTVLATDQPHEGPELKLVAAPCKVVTTKGQKLTRDCPFCRARDSLTIVGFRAATLTSLHIDQIFASRFNDDKKLLTFSDSVQDAAHRAGFFGARTWRTTLRLAMLLAIQEQDAVSLDELAGSLGERWLAKLPLPEWVAQFLPSDLEWLHDWDALRKDGALPEGSDLPDRLHRRLAWEVAMEFGLQANVGRSLPRSGTAVVALAPALLEDALGKLLEPMRNEVPLLRDIQPAAVRAFVVGLLHHLRERGGIMARGLPERYVESGGDVTYSFTLTGELPPYGKAARLPALLTDRPRCRRFETWGSHKSSGWYDRWVHRCLSTGDALVAQPESVYPIALPILVSAGLLVERAGARKQRVWGLSESALVITRAAMSVACDTCRLRREIATSEATLWTSLPCISARCPGVLVAMDGPALDYFGHLYAHGHVQRVFAAEHTGLLERAEREKVEREFKSTPGAGATPRKPWYPNLLSCTPTLEMGIDIGDLSTAILCSVPPAQANYLQRIGRAGRRDGNAMAVTVANARPHDLYFFAQPEEMIAGEVTPPGIYLDAAAVLERQLLAYCFDRWVVERAGSAILPAKLRDVFAYLAEPGSDHFPFSLLTFIEENQATILSGFKRLFDDSITPATGAHLELFLKGSEDGKAGLRWKIVNSFHDERKQRESLAARARSLREQSRKLRGMEAKPLDWKDQVKVLDSEKEALQALVRSIDLRSTLEFLTEGGLLPNYAFPEAAVRLSSVIWRRKKAPVDGKRYDTWTYEYSRAPATALSELAPRAIFYAGGRKVTIDQVDVGVSSVETWRFCDACTHAERVDTGDEAAQCPSCQSVNWRDDGQKFRLLRLRQVFASGDLRKSRIGDDTEEREPKFFQRQMLIDVRTTDRAGAWALDDTRLPFAFEFLRRATFREVNFGEPTDAGAASMIGGLSTVRQGFEICSRCGKVQQDPAEPQHALTCPARKEGAKQDIETCLYLYREFASEALRMLLPMADIGVGQQLNSFVAALQAGLTARFGGSVSHLHTMVYSEPVESSSLRQQFLVLFDTVPGGTGYLKQLVTPVAPGRPMPLFEAMELALKRIEGCVCWNDPDRDGCYRCLFGYRNSRDMDDTSARVASGILRRILDAQGSLKRIESLGEVSITSLVDSLLEARFIEALSRIQHKGTAAKIRTAIVNQKPGYLLTVGTMEWLVEPQVEVTAGQGLGIPVSIDFVLRPSTAGSKRPHIAVFLDGWQYHKDRIGLDLRQRMALGASGQWDAWSFTWADLDIKLGIKSNQAITELAIPDVAAAQAMLTKSGLAPLRDLDSRSTFDLFEAELAGPRSPWEHIGKTLLVARMRKVTSEDTDAWKDVVDRVAPEAAHLTLRSLQPAYVARDAGTISRFFELMAVFDGKTTALVASLDDREENRADPEFKAAWHGYLRLFQLLRDVPNAWFMTTTGTADGALYRPIVSLRSGPDVEAAWSVLPDIREQFRDVARRLSEASVAEPTVGMDVPDDRGDVWITAELVWERERVAVLSREDAVGLARPSAGGWRVFYIEDLGNNVGPVLDAIGEGLKEA